MFFLLSKILAFVISPLTWIVTLLILSLITKNIVLKRRFFISGLVTLIIFTNPFIINTVMLQWESVAYPAVELKGMYDVAIVMGGASKSFNEESKRMVFGGGIDRIIQAVDLYHRKKVKKILLTGGSGYLLNPDFKEAGLLKDVLVNMHIPDSDIIIENNSRNTYENAKFTAELLKSKNYGNRLLVITSALHMPRTLACFNKQGLTPHIFPVDNHASRLKGNPAELILPNAGCLDNWDLLLHEWTGLLLYKISGYI